MLPSARAALNSLVSHAAAAVLLAAALACGGGGGGGGTSGPPAPTTGGLALTVAGLPNLVAGSVQVTGPGGFAQSAQASMTWTGLTPGSYTIAAAPVATYLPSAATQSATVSAGQTTSVTVTYVPQPVSVSVAPSNPKVGTGGTVQLTATVTGSANLAVTWSVDEGAAGGAVTAQGFYTAPNTAGTAHVRATSQADSSKSSVATVTVSARGGFHITPAVVQVAPGGSFDFVAYDDDTPVAAVTWSVPASGGTITASGHFTAAATPGQVTISGTSTASGQTATAIAVVTSNVSFALYGLFDGSHIFPCDGAHYFWNLQPAGVDRTIAFDVVGAPGFGTFHDMGWYRIYIPGATPGAYTVRATPAADPSKARTMPFVLDPAPAVPAFVATGAPLRSRIDHAAAALADGRVLVAGGYGGDPGAYLASLELYSPGSGTFADFGSSLATARIAPVLVALDASRILVCGGQTDYDAAADSAEIVNVATGAVAPAAGPMRSRRVGHRGTLLTSGPHAGKVLVTGGMTMPYFYGTVTATSDLFDPASGLFSASGPNMGMARVYHTATRLADGRVLVAGGTDGSGWDEAATAEVWDPATGAFTSTAGNLKDPRYGHAAVLLANGKVLLTGGDTLSEDYNTCDLFDPATGTFSTAAPMLQGRRRHTATLLPDGRVLVIGGEADYRYHGTAEIYDPVANTWTYHGRMAGPRAGHAAALLPSGKVLVTGELDNASAPTAEVSN